MYIKVKKLIIMLFITILFIILDGITADAYVGCIFAYTYEGQTITYSVLSEPTQTENGTAKVIYSRDICENLSGNVMIPSEVTNQGMKYDVVQIDPIAFMDATNITSLTLPDTITNISGGAFRNCSSLKSIQIPAEVTRIEAGTFYGCSSLIRIDLPDGLGYIGNNAFTDCSKLMYITLPNRLTYLGNGAFARCSSLTDLSLPKDMNFLGAGAFSDCSSLTNLNIPEGITSIEKKTFQNCINLVTVSLPEGIKSIGDHAFYNCNHLTSIHLSDDIKWIGAYAFYNCSSLTEIKIPYAISSIDNFTFCECSNLTKIIIQGNLTSIGDFTFYYCRSLLSINLPDTLTSIGNYSFYGCISLRPVTIPSGVTSIGIGEFPYCGVLVYHNSYAESFFQKNFPMYYQIIKLPLEEMFFAENVRNIQINDTIDLKPLFYPKYSSDITDTIRFRSSDPSAVSVDSDGTILGLSSGEADITAEMGEYSASCHIIVGGTTVNPVAIEFSQSNLKLKKGEAVNLQLNFTPADTTNRKLQWTSSDDSIATVEDGYIYAKNPGTAVITAKSEFASAECIVTVTDPLTGIYSDYNTLILNKGETKRIAVSYDPMDTTDDKTTVWKSEDETIAAVKNGVITANTPGTTTITATVGAFTHRIPVVVQIPIQSLELSQKELALTVGQTLNLPLSVFPEDTTDDILITSSNPSVAAYNDGKITALKRGTSTITVKSGPFFASCLVTVSTDIKSIKLNSTGLTLYLGKSATMAVTFNPTLIVDDRTVIWTSSNEAVLKVDSSGKVKTIGTGTATITALAGGSKTATCTVNVKLSTPASFKAASAGYQSVKLSWGTVSGTNGYQIYRATSAAGSYKMIKETTLNSFTDTGLTAGKTCYYKVRGYHYQGTVKVYSSYTVVASAKPIPSAPMNVKLVKLNSAMIDFTWNRVSGASGYEVYRSSSKYGTFQLVKSTTLLYYMNYGLQKGRTYYYKVRTYVVIGNQKVYSNFSVVYVIKM